MALDIVCVALQVYYWIIFARLILSWFPHPPEGLRPIFEVLYALTEPVLRLARPLIPTIRVGMAALDLSPLLVFVVLLLVTRVVCSA